MISHRLSSRADVVDDLSITHATWLPGDEVVDLDEPGVDMINHPPHYTSSPAVCVACGHQIECIDITRHMNFTLGNALKYIWRVAFGGKANDVEDLGKAVFYVNEERATLAGRVRGWFNK